MALREPIEKEILGKTFILSKFPAIAGREIAAKYAAAGFPNIKDYTANEDTMIKLMSYVAVPIQGAAPQTLSTRALIDNHVGDWQLLITIENAMMDYNSRPLPSERP
jgi:hypothetical protein